MIGKDTLSRWQTAAPFAMSFLLVPLMWVGAVNGGWWLALVPVAAFWVTRWATRPGSAQHPSSPQAESPPQSSPVHSCCEA